MLFYILPIFVFYNLKKILNIYDYCVYISIKMIPLNNRLFIIKHIKRWIFFIGVAWDFWKSSNGVYNRWGWEPLK